jgi:FkbM family methyltransferase
MNIVRKIKRFSRVIGYCGRLSADLKSFFVLLYLFTAFKFFHNFDSVKVRMKYQGKKFDFHISDRSDLTVIEEIFIKEEYEIENADPKVIFDLGSNVGASVIYFKLLYSGASIYAFEPDPRAFSKLRKNTAQFTDIHLYNCAISDKDGQMDFYVNPGISISSSCFQRSGNLEKIAVPAKSIATVLSEEKIANVDLLKFDVEGAEYAIFEKFSDHEKVKRLIGEIHEDISGKTLKEFIGYFPGRDIKTKPSMPRRYIVNIS